MYSWDIYNGFCIKSGEVTEEKYVWAAYYYNGSSLPPLTPPGLYSSIMRDMAYNPSESPKWIVLDGDVDPMWIESLNTVMDDNKV